MGDESKLEFMRYASPNEQRTICREDLGFYHAVIIGAIYDFEGGTAVDSPETFFRPLRGCIEQHPFLCVVVGDMHTDKAFYQRVSAINLEDHISILDVFVGDDAQNSAIEKVLESNIDREFRSGIPPWRITVLPSISSRCYISFEYSHMIGDGPTGLAFHQTFLQTFNAASSTSPVSAIVQTPVAPLPAPFDTPQRLPISWSYLFAPLFALLMPQFIATKLGFQISASSIDAGTWTATNMSFDPNTTKTKVRVYEIEQHLLDKAIRVSRQHDSKLTGTIHVLLTRALSKVIVDPSITNFVSQTAVNMRGSIGAPKDEMGEYASVCYLSHPRSSSSQPFSVEEWEAASGDTKKLETCASTLQDQPIGLLRFLPSIRKWTLGKLGQRRDCSYEMSNVGLFDPVGNNSDGPVKITKVVFTQPGHVTSAPIAFNFASLKGGSLLYTISWHGGALGVGNDEDRIVDEMASSIRAGFEALGLNSGASN